MKMIYLLSVAAFWAGAVNFNANANANANACDLLRDFRLGASRSEIQRKLGDRFPVMEMKRCGGSEISVPAGLFCRDVPGVRDARLALQFTENRLTGWQITRRGDKMELLTYAEKQWGIAKNRPPLDVARPWANLHWQGKGWQASYVGQGDGKEITETLVALDTNPATRATARRAPECEKE